MLPLLLLLPLVDSSVPRGHGTILTMFDHMSGVLADVNMRKYAYNPDLKEERPFNPNDTTRVPVKTAPWFTSKKELDELKPTRKALFKPEALKPGSLRGRKLWGGGDSSTTGYTYTDTEISSTTYTIGTQYGFDFDSEAMEGSGSGSGDGDWYTYDGDDYDFDDGKCHMDGFAFIGSSYSIPDYSGFMGCTEEDTGNYGNPYTYPINSNQFRMQCIIDRQFSYLVSSDADGWLVGGGYRAYNNAGMQFNRDSSHTELLRIGSTCGDYGCGGITRELIYEKMAGISQPVLRSYPKYVKAGGGGSDIELEMQMVDEYDDDGGGGDSYSLYEQWSEAILDEFAGYPCTDDSMTDEHISMIRGVNFKSGDDMYTYLYQANYEVAKWQNVYQNQGVAIGTQESICLAEDDIFGEYENYYERCKEAYGYGNVQYFHGRNEMVRTFWADQSQMTDEDYELSTYFDTYGYFPAVNDDDVYDMDEMSGSGDYSGDSYDCEDYNQYTWQNWDLQEGFTPPCNCYASGRTFLGIPLMNYFPTSSTPLIYGGPYESILSPDIFNWKVFCDTQQKWVESGSSNHMCLTGVETDEATNAGGFLEQPDSMMVELFGMGFVNELGGQDLDDFINSIASNMKWNSLTLAPGYIGVTASGDVALFYIMDPASDVGQLYTSLCQGYGNPMFGDLGNIQSSNYCARSKVSDSAEYGCWAADSSNNKNNYQTSTSDGGFCLYSVIMLGPKFYSTDAQIAYLEYANDQLDEWRQSMMNNGRQPSFTPQSNGDFCQGKSGCLAFFFGRSAPYVAFDGQGNYYYYDNAFLQVDGGDYSGGGGGLDVGTGIAQGPSEVAKAFELTINLLALSIAAFLGVLMLRKYRRRRKKGMSNYEIFFGSSRRRWKRKAKKYNKDRRDKRERRKSARGRQNEIKTSRSDLSKTKSGRKSSTSKRRSDEKTQKLLESPSSRYAWIDDKQNNNLGEIFATSNRGNAPTTPNNPGPMPSFGFQDVIAKNLLKKQSKNMKKGDSKPRSGTGEGREFRPSVRHRDSSKDRNRERSSSKGKTSRKKSPSSGKKKEQEKTEENSFLV